MSHEILQTEDGTFAMAYREGDALPWHASETNPQTFAPGASADEIMKAARLGYEVQVVPNCFPSGAPIADSFHISRTDAPGTVYGRFVAGAWQPVQNRDVVNLASRIEADHGFEIITAGALFGGSKVFVQLDAGREFTLPGHDTLVSRLLATSSHTGTESNKFVGCNTRVVCNNTVRAALGETGGIVAHDHRVEFDADAIITAVGLNAERFGDFAELAQLMATRALSDAEALEYFKTVLGGREKIEDSASCASRLPYVKRWPRTGGKPSWRSAPRMRPRSACTLRLGLMRSRGASRPIYRPTLSRHRPPRSTRATI
jgi:phage/plasmid-like protein (TIGR03299 family)